jgi:hypothetical protein
MPEVNLDQEVAVAARRTAAVAAITDPERRGREAWALLREFAGRDQLLFVRERAPKIAGVAARCGPCFRSLGRRAPALLILEPVDAPHRWLIHQVATWGRSDPSGTRSEYLPGQHARSWSRILRGRTPAEYEAWGTKLHIACRRCPNKPRVAAHTLCAEADRAVAKGRDYFFV